MLSGMRLCRKQGCGCFVGVTLVLSNRGGQTFPAAHLRSRGAEATSSGERELRLSDRNCHDMTCLASGALDHLIAVSPGLGDEGQGGGTGPELDTQHSTCSMLAGGAAVR